MISVLVFQTWIPTRIVPNHQAGNKITRQCKECKDVLAKIGQIIKMLDGVRGKNTKVRSLSKEIGDDLIDIKDLVKEYHKKVKSAITADTNINGKSKQYQPA